MFRSGKDKAFFFVDTEIRRDRSQTPTSRVVPLQSYRDGRIGYIRQTNASTGATCTTAARANNPATAGCIGYLSPADVASRDPQGVGFNVALQSLYNSRFPLPNDLTGGDGINTGLYRWNAPNVRDDKIYTFRVDVVPTDRQRLFVRTTITRRDSTNAVQFLPQDEDAVTFQDRSYSIAANHNWIITENLSNVITAGLSKSQNIFTPPSETPSFPYSFAGGILGGPFPSLSFQDRHVSVPTFRDDITWTAGSHTIFAGVSFKPIRQLSSLISDFNFVTLGFNTTTPNLNTAPGIRPADLLNNTTAISRFDNAFVSSLGRIASVSTNYNYNSALQALPAGTGKTRNYAYNEYEGYIQDNWRITSGLTLNLGVRYTLYPAPYETNGIFASDQTDWKELLAKRVANAAAGISGDAAEPFLVYNLAGKANDAAPLYRTDKNNFAPRLGFAYAPSFKDGFMGALFGDRKTVIRGSFDRTFDRVAGAVLFIQNQSDYLFANSASRSFGSTSATTALLNDPRFSGVSSVPAPVNTVPPVITRPFTPFVTNGVPFGTEQDAGGNSNFTVDHDFKTPYSDLFSFGIQRELPGNHLFDISYVGRRSRSQFVQSDVAQVLNFKDPTSGQFLFDAFNQVQSSLLACQALGTQPAACRAQLPAIQWFESQVGAAVAANYGGAPCSAFGLGANCTQLAANITGNFFEIGDTSDAIQSMLANGTLFNNVGLSAQFPTNAYISNQGTADYHGMLVSLQKRFSRGIEYEVNYTFSKSLDNQSTVANTVFGGLVCDVLNPDVCRGPSDFDITHLFNANFIVDLPFGRGRTFGSNVNRFVDTIFGGWTLSGIISARSGLAFSAAPSAASYPLSYNLGSPAIITNLSALQNTGVRTSDDGTTIQFFADPAAANAALRDPRHGELGSRNQLRGPGFWGLDMGLAKKITAPWSENHKFTLRVDAFNVTNTPQFGLPGITRNSGTFGQIGATSNTARELQFAVRYDF